VLNCRSYPKNKTGYPFFLDHPVVVVTVVQGRLHPVNLGANAPSLKSWFKSLPAIQGEKEVCVI